MLRKELIRKELPCNTYVIIYNTRTWSFNTYIIIYNTLVNTHYLLSDLHGKLIYDTMDGITKEGEQ